MNNANSQQKKKTILTYVYATIIGLLIVACAVVIAVTTRNSSTGMNNGSVNVSTNSYIVPMRDYTIQKDYSGSELQYNDTLKQWEIHKAIDFSAGENSDVMAVADGTVSNVYTNYLEGTVVEITHANGVISIYKSLAEDSVAVSTGDSVSAGTVIGQASDSMAQELNNGAHLHFEMTVNGVKVDPNDYLSLGDK